LQLAIENPPERGQRVQIFNQMTETHRVRDLAELVSRLTGAEIRYLTNPRKEAVENDLHVKNDLFLAKGLNPTLLSDGLLMEVNEIAQRYADRADLSKIPATSQWRQQPKA
jgi:UDP-sulfoquinovose synthase